MISEWAEGRKKSCKTLPKSEWLAGLILGLSLAIQNTFLLSNLIKICGRNLIKIYGLNLIKICMLPEEDILFKSCIFHYC